MKETGGGHHKTERGKYPSSQRGMKCSSAVCGKNKERNVRPKVEKQARKEADSARPACTRTPKWKDFLKKDFQARKRGCGGGGLEKEEKACGEFRHRPIPETERMRRREALTKDDQGVEKRECNKGNTHHLHDWLGGGTHRSDRQRKLRANIKTQAVNSKLESQRTGEA